ncbi:MAG: response regulator [Eggerthellaceae bacterium]|nr:response regulator [Eggerthellaceae bacterium]
MIAGIFAVAHKTSEEMYDSAIQSLNENLNLMKSTIDAIVASEARFQEVIGEEVALSQDPAAYIQGLHTTDAIAMLSVVMEGQAQGISSDGKEFSPESLDFSSRSSLQGHPVSQSFVNSTGTWAYTIASPLVRNGEDIGTLYVEYTYDTINDALPKSFYNGQAVFYLMDSANERFVLKPDGMGEREAGHLNLEDFYRANNITDEQTIEMVRDGVESAQNVLFAHDVKGQESLCFLWPVNGGADFMVGYVPMDAIQKEAHTVNAAIAAVTAITFISLALCVALYAHNRRKQMQIQREREAERARHQEQLTQALRAAEVANESKSAFLANMSHDIRTPMNAVIGFTTLLSKEADDPEKVREYAAKIIASGKHLLALINDVLDISKIESGKATLNLAEFALRDSIQAVEAITAPLAEAKHQTFITEVEGITHERFIGDETHLNQVLLNLLSNAVKYTPEGGTIHLRFLGGEQRSGQFAPLTIEVEDNGYGMTPEFLERIFDSFTRAENSTTNKVQGTGLGMAITKSLVDLMGGSIEVTSEEGVGSLFRVYLELRIPDGSSAADDQDWLSATAVSADDVDAERFADALKGKHFLAAEDNAFNMMLLEELLEIEGATVEIVENGQLAVERMESAQAGEFDAILMDVQMPVMNGHDATRAIRKLDSEYARTIPIIAMTADAFVEDERAAIAAGMDRHLSKPLDVDKLKRVIVEISEERNA